MRTAPGRLVSTLLSQDPGTEISAPELLQTQACVNWTNRDHNHSTVPAPDRLAHNEWACACPLLQAVPELNHPQIPPLNELWIADELQPESDPAPHRKANVLRSPRSLYSSA